MVKHTIRYTTLSLIILCLFGSCTQKHNIIEQPEYLLDVAQKDNNLQLFVRAAKRLDITILERSDRLTVFAPSNAAIQDYLDKKSYPSIDAVPIEELYNLISNHIIQGDYAPSILPVGYVSTLATAVVEGKSIPVSTFFERRGRDIQVNGVLVNPNVSWAENGVLYTVNQLIAIPNAVDHLLINPYFSSFVSMLQRKDLDQDYMAIFERTANATLFVPTNAAFAAFLTERRISSLDQVPADVMSTILRYHLCTDTHVATTDQDGAQELKTLQGGMIALDKKGLAITVRDALNRQALVVQPDVQGSNAVIQAINRILLPN
jgi:uncharacterized surface protein with fasciclin (FAS1) repeats